MSRLFINGSSMRYSNRMIRINVAIDGNVVVSMLEMVMAAADSLQQRRAVEVDAYADDPELQEVMARELRENLRADCEVLADLLQHNDFGRGRVELSESAAEGALRACSAIRLRLRQSALRHISGEQLEQGTVEIVSLPHDQQRAYACYVFLAGIQSLIIEQLDPDAAN